jgi:hypothetical protein
MDKLIKKKESQIKEKEKEIKRLKLLSVYKKKEDKILDKLRQIKSKSKVSKKVSPKRTGTSNLTNGLIYTGTGIASLIALYRLYKIFNEPKQLQPIQMETI